MGGGGTGTGSTAGAQEAEGSEAWGLGTQAGARAAPGTLYTTLGDVRKRSETSPSWPGGGGTRDPAQPVRVLLTWLRGPDAFPHPQRLGKGGAGGDAPSPNAASASGGVDTPDSVLPPGRAEGDFEAPPPWLLDPGEQGPPGRGRRPSCQYITKGGERGAFLGFGRGWGDLSFKHLTANGSVDRGQPERATGGREMANLVPTYPLEGKGGEGGVCPLSLVPWGSGEPAAR